MIVSIRSNLQAIAYGIYGRDSKTHASNNTDAQDQDTCVRISQ